jgi:parvulin-like peptidyl-prolyl isomerase
MNRCAEHCWHRLILLSLLLAHLLSVAAWADDSASVSRAATVNGVVISTQEFTREFERIQRQKGAGATNADEAALALLKREALENLIIRELLYQQSVKQNIAVDAAVVEREMQQAKAKFASPGQFAENLQRIGMTETTVREQVARGLAIRALIDRSVSAELTASEAEINSYYQDHKDAFTKPTQIRLSHILITPDTSWPRYNKKEASALLIQLRNKILSGADFAALAKEHSHCLSKAKGGDIGWFAAGDLTPEMHEAVVRLKAGEVSEIVEDKFGLHLIKLVERTPGVTQPIEEVREKIRGLVRQEKSITRLQRYVKGLRDVARVELLLTGE